MNCIKPLSFPELCNFSTGVFLVLITLTSSAITCQTWLLRPSFRLTEGRAGQPHHPVQRLQKAIRRFEANDGREGPGGWWRWRVLALPAWARPPLSCSPVTILTISRWPLRPLRPPHWPRQRERPTFQAASTSLLTHFIHSLVSPD